MRSIRIRYWKLWENIPNRHLIVLKLENPFTDRIFLYKMMISPKLLINILGWTGSILYLIAYALVSLKKVEGDSLLYQGMNIIAGILLVIYTISLGAYATTALNIIWAAIGVFTLGRKWLTRS